MIARLASDDVSELLSAETDSAASGDSESVEQLVCESRRDDWLKRGRSQVVFNGPPSSARDETAKDSTRESDQR